MSSDLMTNLKEIKEPNKIADHISAQLNISIPEKQKLLEAINLKLRLEKIMEEHKTEKQYMSVFQCTLVNCYTNTLLDVFSFC